MSTSINDLKLKSQQANEMIEKLKKQIQQIKLESSPEFVAKQTVSLQTENDQLKAKIEQLKAQLEAAEAKRGVSTPKVTETVTTPAAPVTTTTVKAEKPAAPEAAKPKEEKKPKQEKAAPAKKEEYTAENVDISKLDIRVGKIVNCQKHPEADALYVEQIDLGEGKLRNVCSGLVKYIPLEEMQNRMVVLLCNLKPAKLRGVASEAMVLCASTPEKVELIDVPAGAQVGDRVTVDGFEGEPVAEINTKNKIFEFVQPDLKTNDSLLATYKGKTLEIKGKGPLKSQTLKNVPIK